MGAPINPLYYINPLENESKSFPLPAAPEQRTIFKSGRILYSGTLIALPLMGDFRLWDDCFTIGFTYRKIMTQYIFSEISIGCGICLVREAPPLIITGSLCLYNKSLGLYGGPSLLHFCIPGAILGWQLNEHVAIEMKSIAYFPYSLSLSFSF